MLCISDDFGIPLGRNPLPTCSGSHRHRVQLRSSHQHSPDNVSSLYHRKRNECIGKVDCSADWVPITSLGYLPGHIHAFWLIYKKMQAEERYGNGGFQCAYSWVTPAPLIGELTNTSFSRYWQRPVRTLVSWQSWRSRLPSAGSCPAGSLLWSNWSLIAGSTHRPYPVHAHPDWNIVLTPAS